MDWLKQHADTIVIVSSFILCFWHLNEKITSLDKDLAVIKTVMIMKNILPADLAKQCQDYERIKKEKSTRKVTNES